jgi:hypothetical protein
MSSQNVAESANLPDVNDIVDNVEKDYVYSC